CCDSRRVAFRAIAPLTAFLFLEIIRIMKALLLVLQSAILFAGVSAMAAPADQPFQLHGRSRTESSPGEWKTVEKTLEWKPGATAVVVCDMWDKHHCPDATERVGELVPRMNEVLKAARKAGALIIHCPSETMPFYTNYPGRKLAQDAPKI